MSTARSRWAPIDRWRPVAEAEPDPWDARNQRALAAIDAYLARAERLLQRAKDLEDVVRECELARKGRRAA